VVDAGATASTGSPGGHPPIATTSTTAAPPDVVVQAAGAVVRPGVYHVASNARVQDVVTAAGGPTADADLQAVALAARVTDGGRVYVPRQGEALPPGATPPGMAAGGRVPVTAPTPSAPLDLNEATVDELDALPGVGPATAKAIVDYRTDHGPFSSVDDLLDVRGIGPAKLDAFRNLVRVG
jgi:competence protein ComEA